MRVIADQGELYLRCAAALAQSYPSAPQLVVEIASLHGHDGRRIASEPPSSSTLGAALSAFDEALRRVISSDEAWSVRTVSNIVGEERLEQFLTRLQTFEGPRHHVRVFVSRHIPSALAPLIVARTVAFLASDDDRYHRASSGIEIDDPAAVAWAGAYFDRIWNAAPYRIRDGTGIDGAEVERLRKHVLLGDHYAELISSFSGEFAELERDLRRLVGRKLGALAARDGRAANPLIAEALPRERRSIVAGETSAVLEALTWRELLDVIRRWWTLFEPGFGDRRRFDMFGEEVLGERPHAHAKPVDAAELALQRRAIAWFRSRMR